MRKVTRGPIPWLLILLTAAPPWAFAQAPGAQAAFNQGEIEQLLAPIALYPDELLSQILMASTYPLEVIQADRWVKQHIDLKGNALTTALEKEGWDPSVKSLVNFPQVLAIMNEKLDWMQKLGDAFLAQQKEVMDTIQKLRAKAQAEGNLKTTKEQKIIVEQQVIKIEPASPQVIYVPTYNPTVVYGAWPYPAYPPYYYYPPGYVAATAAFSFAAGVAVGAAWGYAWGGCNWGRGEVNIDINRNINVNQNINRARYTQQMNVRGQLDQAGRGTWQHNAVHRQDVAYRNQATAQQFNRGTATDAARSREAFRGRAEQGRQALARGGVEQFRARQGAERRGGEQLGNRHGFERQGGAFSGMDRGSEARSFSDWGRTSRESMHMSRGSFDAGRGSGGFSGSGAGRGGGGFSSAGAHRGGGGFGGGKGGHR
jgi:hypothetical protein